MSDNVSTLYTTLVIDNRSVKHRLSILNNLNDVIMTILRFNCRPLMKNVKLCKHMLILFQSLKPELSIDRVEKLVWRMWKEGNVNLLQNSPTWLKIILIGIRISHTDLRSIKKVLTYTKNILSMFSTANLDTLVPHCTKLSSRFRGT